MISEGDILKVVLDYFYPGASTALNVFHFVFGGVDKEEEDVLTDLVEWATNEWANHWEDLADDNTILESIAIQEVNNTGLVLRDIGTAVLNIPGTSVGGSVSPAAVAGYLQGDTVTPGVMGRKYVPGIEEAAISQGLFNATAVVTLGLLLLGYITPFNATLGGTYFPAVISKKLLDVALLQVSGLIETVPAYQRRRKVGVGS